MVKAKKTKNSKSHLKFKLNLDSLDSLHFKFILNHSFLLLQIVISSFNSGEEERCTVEEGCNREDTFVHRSIR